MHHWLAGAPLALGPLTTPLTALSLVATTAPLPAQVAPALVPGDRVRVAPRGERRAYVARVVRLRGDTLWLDVPAARGTRPDTTFAIPLIGVRRLERSVGAQRHVQRNMWIGAAAGAVLGALVGTAAADETVEPAEAGVFLGAAGALPGAAIGALTGLRRTESWEDVSLARGTPRAPDAATSRGYVVRPRVRSMRVPRRGAPPARALAIGVTVRRR